VLQSLVNQTHQTRNLPNTTPRPRCSTGETYIAAPFTPPASSQHCTTNSRQCIVVTSPDKRILSVLLSSRRHTLQIPPLSRTIPQQLLDQIDMCQQHAAAAVARESQFVEGISVVSQTSNKSVSRNVFSSSFLSTIGLSFSFFVFVRIGWDGMETYRSWSMSLPSSSEISLRYLVQRSPTTCTSVGFSELYLFLVVVRGVCGLGVWGAWLFLLCRRRSSGWG
jgi:hypothetical protein